VVNIQFNPRRRKMAFERYLRRKGFFTKPLVSIWKTGLISINDSAHRQLGLEKMTHAVLFYDRDNKKIGLRFVDSSKEEGAIRLGKRKGSTYIYARGFLGYYGVDLSKALRFTPVHDEKHNIFVLEAEQNNLE